ncbi:helix-turn-helix transcriptional regulator [Asticcacaulis sp. 201]|uniref:AraC family transcriptional regulator n=1 Tax=Asticcacaulis sp. 201 TaxID=3028787 RepID=UPI00291699D4|nr:helix-turn-helix transcriptional regulator [Asticcacaulis sp. 201]MDV6332087.1 helix-turn-helix transcriptional regulator [Asticcacaulis sp. 201]
MEGNPLDSVETWQCVGDSFEKFQDVICTFFHWNCAQESGGPDFQWQMNLGVLKSQEDRNDPQIHMARLISTSGFVQIQTTASHDVIIIMPVKGYLNLRRGTMTQKVTAGQAMIYQPMGETHVSHIADGQTCEAYIIKVSFSWVQRFLFDILQLPVERDLRLGPVIDLGTPKARVLSRLISTLCSDAFTFQSRDLSPSLQHRLVETFSHLLLESIPHRYSDRMQTTKAGPMPNYLRLARDYMQREARNNPSMADVAKAANISVRTLETSFRAHLDVTPHAYLRTMRLKMTRQALMEGRDGRSIADVAAAHGFPHAGRFAQYYTELFGESPSETRRKGPLAL